MAENKNNSAVAGLKARAEAKKQQDVAKAIMARIKAAKARRRAKRPKPRLGSDSTGEA
jgi:hypothetical protein